MSENCKEIKQKMREGKSNKAYVKVTKGILTQRTKIILHVVWIRKSKDEKHILKNCTMIWIKMIDVLREN